MTKPPPNTPQPPPAAGLDLYKKSGVDVAEGDAAVHWLQSTDESLSSGRFGSVVEGIGGFAAMFCPNFSTIREPLLVSSTDGVGTKVLFAIEHDRLEGLGGDLVGMCVNDLYTVGARPLFFLDYFATGKLSSVQFKAVLSGIRRALKSCDCALLGGETAELPGLYAQGHFDLAGFVVGVVDRSKTLGSSRVREGDVLIGLPSSGFHSNGFSLLRKWLTEAPALAAKFRDALLAPTRIYAGLPELLESPECAGNVHAAAHITGGGISGNLQRVLPASFTAEINPQDIPTPPWMRELLLHQGSSDVLEFESVFNLGVGMILVVAPSASDAIRARCAELDLGEACVLGRVRARAESDDAPVVFRQSGQPPPMTYRR